MNLVLLDNESSEIVFNKTDYRYVHIVDTLKLSVGDSFKAGIINGFKGRAIIEKLNNDNIIARFLPEQNGVFSLPLILIIGHPRPTAAKRIIKDCASMGVSKILFFCGQNAEKSYMQSALWKKQEYKSALREGAAQGGHTFLPEINVYKSLYDLIERNIFSLEKKVYFDIFEADFYSIPKAGSFVLAVGPERGWTGDEIALLKRSSFLSCSLGPTILRTETSCAAAVASACVINNYFERK